MELHTRLMTGGLGRTAMSGMQAPLNRYRGKVAANGSKALILDLHGSIIEPLDISFCDGPTPPAQIATGTHRQFFGFHESLRASGRLGDGVSRHGSGEHWPVGQFRLSHRYSLFNCSLALRDSVK